MSDQGHTFNFDTIGTWSEPVTFAVDRDQTVAYANATNDDAAPHVSGEYASPVFAIVPAFELMAMTTMAAVPAELHRSVLHGEQDMRFVRPIRPGDLLSCRARVLGIHGKSSGVTVTTHIETRDATNELVNEQYFTGFFRGGRLEGGQGEAAPAHGFDAELRGRDADHVAIQKFDEDQTYRYRDASGDTMPIHTDEEFAKKMGLPGIIIHGLCTMAFTSRAVIEYACPEDPSRLKRLVVRFSAPAQPRHTITTSLWTTSSGTSGGASDGVATYAFETVTDEGTPVIKDGLAEVSL